MTNNSIVPYDYFYSQNSTNQIKEGPLQKTGAVSLKNEMGDTCKPSFSVKFSPKLKKMLEREQRLTVANSKRIQELGKVMSSHEVKIKIEKVSGLITGVNPEIPQEPKKDSQINILEDIWLPSYLTTSFAYTANLLVKGTSSSFLDSLFKPLLIRSVSATVCKATDPLTNSTALADAVPIVIKTARNIVLGGNLMDSTLDSVGYHYLDKRVADTVESPLNKKLRKIAGTYALEMTGAGMKCLTFSAAQKNGAVAHNGMSFQLLLKLGVKATACSMFTATGFLFATFNSASVLLSDEA